MLLTVFTQDAMLPVGAQAEKPTAWMADAASTRLTWVVLAHRFVAMLSEPTAKYNEILVALKTFLNTKSLVENVYNLACSHQCPDSRWRLALANQQIHYCRVKTFQ